jgi:hypothetical protein
VGVGQRHEDHPPPGGPERSSVDARQALPLPRTCEKPSAVVWSYMPPFQATPKRRSPYPSEELRLHRIRRTLEPRRNCGGSPSIPARRISSRNVNELCRQRSQPDTRAESDHLAALTRRSLAYLKPDDFPATRKDVSRALQLCPGSALVADAPKKLDRGITPCFGSPPTGSRIPGADHH